MSQTSDEKRHRKHAISKPYASTPHGNVSTKRYSISISRIDTASSSSGDRINWKSQIPEKRLDEKSSKNRKPRKRRRVVFRLEDTDSEWETKSEEFITEVLNSGEASARVNLFESPRTPEKVRDAPIRFQEEALLESPIIRSSRRFRSSRLISKPVDVEQQGQLLPVHLPSAELRNRFDSDEDELTFHHESNMKTYSVARKRKKSPEGKLGDFMFPVQVPTLISDQLWNQFIEKDYGRTSHYLASLPARGSDRPTTSASKVPNEKLETDPILPGMKRIRDCGIKNSRKWESFKARRNLKRRMQFGEDGPGIRKSNKKKREEEILPSTRKQRTDVYDQSDETDIEFETGGRDNERMTLSEFRCKQNVDKVSNRLSSVSSDSDTE